MGGSKNRDVLATLYEAVALIFIGFFSPTLIGFAAKGFDTQAIINQSTLYQGLLIGGIITIILCWLIEKFALKGDNLYGSSVFFASQGQFPSFSGFKRFRSVQLAHFSILIFGALFGFAYLAKTGTFTGIFRLEQQFTPTANFLFSSGLVAASENAFWAAIITLILSLVIRPIARRRNWSQENFRVITGALWIIGGVIIGVLLHLLRYGPSEVSILKVAVFWGIGGLVTYLTGSFLPFWIMHLMNNVLLDVNGLFSSERTVIFVVLIYLAFLISYIFIWRGRLLGDRVRTLE